MFKWALLAVLLICLVLAPCLLVVSLPFGVSMVSSILNSGNQQDDTIQMMRGISNALILFNADVGRYPSQEEGFTVLVERPGSDSGKWDGPYISGQCLDAWGRPIRYLAGQQPVLMSPGRDGVFGTKDDIEVEVRLYEGHPWSILK